MLYPQYYGLSLYIHFTKLDVYLFNGESLGLSIDSHSGTLAIQNPSREFLASQPGSQQVVTLGEGAHLSFEGDAILTFALDGSADEGYLLRVAGNNEHAGSFLALDSDSALTLTHDASVARCAIGTSFGGSIDWAELCRLTRGPSLAPGGNKFNLSMDETWFAADTFKDAAYRDTFGGRLTPAAHEPCISGHTNYLHGVNVFLHEDVGLQKNPAFTISMLLLLDPVKDSTPQVVLESQLGSGRKVWDLRRGPKDCLRFGIEPATGAAQTLTTTSLETGHWYHVTLWSRGNESGIFVNGYPQTAGATQPAPAIDWPTGGLTVTPHFTGKLAKLSISNHVLSDAEVMAQARAALGKEFRSPGTKSIADEVFGKATQVTPTPDGTVEGSGCAAGSPCILEFWVRPDNPELPSALIGVASGGTTAAGWNLVSDEGVAILQWRDADRHGEIRSAYPVFAAGEWSHIAITFDKKEVALLVNGQPVGAVTSSTGLPAFDSYRLGGYFGPTYHAAQQSCATARVSPDGRRLAVARKQDCAILICDSTGKVLQTLQAPRDGGHVLPAEALVWGPDGKKLYSSCRTPLVCAWDIEHGKLLYTYETGHTEAEAPDLAISPDGTVLAVSVPEPHNQHEITHLVDAATGKRREQGSRTWVSYPSGKSQGLYLMAAPDLHVLSIREQGWEYYRTDLDHGDCTKSTMYRHAIRVGQVIVAVVKKPWTADMEFMMGDILRSGNLDADPDFRGGLAMSPDNHWLICSRRGDPTRFGLWNLLEKDRQDDPTFLGDFAGHSGAVSGLSFSMDSTQLASVGKDKKLCIWDLNKQLKNSYGIPGTATSILAVADGFVVLAEDGSLLTLARFAPLVGRIANDRLTSTLPEVAAGKTIADSIRAKLDADILRESTGSVFPLEFSLLNDRKQPVLYMGDSARALVLEIRNIGKRTVHLPAADGQLELRFRPGTLVQPERVKLGEKGIGANDATGEFSLSYVQAPDRTDCFIIRLLAQKTTSSDGTLLPGAAIRIRLAELQANELGDERTTRVQLRYRLRFDATTPLEGSRIHNLSIQKIDINQLESTLGTFSSAQQTTNEGVSNTLKALSTEMAKIAKVELLHIQSLGVAISAGVHGVPAILCDGQTPQEFTVRFSNHTTAAIELSTGSDPNDKASAFTISWDVTNERPWGLSSTDHLNNLIVTSLTEGWEAEPVDHVLQQVRIVNKGHKVMAPLSDPDAKNQALEVKFSGFTCDADPGMAWLYVSYVNMGPMVDKARSHGHTQITVERTPVLPMSRDKGPNRTVVDGGLDLVNSPAIRLHEGIAKETVPGAADAALLVRDKNLVLEAKGGAVAIEKLHITGELQANSKNITGVGELSATQITATNGVTYSAHPGNLVPRGCIMMWSPSFDPSTNTPTKIPDGWCPCDGHMYNAAGQVVYDSKLAVVRTPNLTSRFIMGAGEGEDAADKYGDAQSHDHSLWTDRHDGAATETGGAHQHGWPERWYGRMLDDGDYCGIDTGGQVQHSTDTHAGHTHTFSVPSLTGRTETKVANRPSWYALAFIMKL